MNAQAEPVALDIPSQGLVGALNTLAKQADLQLLYSPENLRDTPVPAIKGNMEPEQALRLLLRGSGLTYQLDGHTVILNGASNSSAMELGPLKINANRLDATSEGTESYAGRAVTIGKGTHTLRETPQAVTVLTRKFMDDQNINTIDQAMENPWHRGVRVTHGRQVLLLPRLHDAGAVPVRRRAAGCGR